MRRFSRHARQRMLERAISEEDVEAVLGNPDVTFADPSGNPCSIREVNGRRIKVVVKAADTDFVITTIDLDS